MPQPPVFPHSFPAPPVRVAAAHVQAALSRVSQAKMPASPHPPAPAARPGRPVPFVPPHPGIATAALRQPVAQRAAAAVAPAVAVAPAASLLAGVIARVNLSVRAVFASRTKSGSHYNWHVGFEFTHGGVFRRWHAHFTGDANGSPTAVTSAHFKTGHKKTDPQYFDDDAAEALTFLQRLDRVFPAGWLGSGANPRPYRSV